MRLSAALLTAAFCAAAGAAAAADLSGTSSRVQARADVYGAPPAEERTIPFSGVVPACDAAEVLAWIQGEFASREARFWNSGLRIVGYEHVRPIAFRPWGASFVPRRHCTATAFVQEGPVVRERRVDYIVREDLGVFAQSSYTVDWCVVGVERHLHAAPACKMMRP